MSGASFILAINLCVACLFAAAFFLVAANNRSDRVAVWFGTAYLFGVGYFIFEFLLPFQADPKLTGFLAFASFLGAVGTVTVGIARRYRMPVPWPLLAATVAPSLIVNWFTFDLGRNDPLRLFAYQTPYAAMAAIAVGIIVLSRRRQPMDYGLLALFTISAMHFLAKPFIAMATGGPGGSAQEYIGTQYALFSQSISAVVSLATALLMLMLLVRDMLVDITTRSETDLLSGLFNRRGFETRVEPALAAAGRAGVPAAFVACDLDHFKGVNDAFGHDGGDRVIESFARLLHAVAPPGSVCGRLGGEEFAVYLPGADLRAARLFAESARATFSTMPVPGVADDARFTASFGVAEASGSASLSDVRRRADVALYVAKRGGRDRVHVADDPGTDAMPHHPYALEAPRRKRPARSL
jgi:diguanylate cyclase (GGDEF)-like protein